LDGWTQGGAAPAGAANQSRPEQPQDGRNFYGRALRNNAVSPCNKLAGGKATRILGS
jgi:hypothetical protein